MSRSTPEWIAKHDDQAIPARVKLRAKETHTRRRKDQAITLEWLFDRTIPEPNSGCWIWMAAIDQRTGYGAVKRGEFVKRTHRIAFEIANNCIVPSRLDVCHRCDVRCCINPCHLFTGTRRENMQDCAAKGRVIIPDLKGEDCPAAKLKASDVRIIRNDPRSQRKIAADYGVNRGTIAGIKNGKTWRSLI